ncbi:histidine kinase [Sphingobacterium sp. N143]|uniref:sensor histidine kinase n=1 Tax=Sphingobacterium sp. N143 TaxID=2746727 RepID=UPI002577C9D8|nr:histidine kinase [Sphingobacterium sp. N143]MDM1293001.1 histidine kinase [Sphingobacterium sp. N143]
MQDKTIYKNEKNLISTNKKRLLFTILSFFLIYLIAYIIDPFSSCWNGYFQRNIFEILGEWTFTIIYSFLISEFSIFMHAKLDRVITWKDNPTERLIIETVINLFVVLLINLLLVYMISRYYYELRNVTIAASLEEKRGVIQNISISVMVALLIMGINIGIHLINNWKNESIRAAKLGQVILETELQSLKLQIDPHFVFNNLSVLSEIILEDQQLGYEYAENFSKIYRYLLVNSKKDVISLEEELNFLDSYIFLIKNRFGDGVNFEINVDPAKYNDQLPPLTLQLLVENALKHNQTNKKKPLKIKVYTNSQNQLVVENTLIPIENVSESSGIGISNIIKRYDLLSHLQPQIMNTGRTFKVNLPLIEQAS